MRLLGKGRAWLLASSLLSANLMVNADDEPNISDEICEEITESPLPDDDHFFNFHQHDERLDPNQFVKVVFGIMSKLKPDPIKKVQLDYNPILHHLVGPYKMRSTVSHETPNGLVVNCFDIVIQIHDTDECEYHGNPNWEHQCDSSTNCVNTEGGYYCACDEGKFAVKDSGNGKCDGHHDSTECCGVVTYDGAPHGDFMCRSDFKCHSDACAFNECDENAQCTEGKELNTYTCECNNGYRDISDKTGRKCEFVDHCVDDPNACPIGCECQSVTTSDSDGFYCLPSEGYATYYPEHDYEWVEKPIDNPLRLDEVNHMCVPLDAPEMTIAGPAPLVLRQGEKYEEYGVNIIDESTANLQRRFETNYDTATDLMDLSGFVRTCGTSVITYTLRTPWLHGHEQATASRIVEVVDQDECTYDGDDDTFKHQCHFPAVCVNVACGTEGFKNDEPSYRCECEHKGFEPDGHDGCVKKKKHRKNKHGVLGGDDDDEGGEEDGNESDTEDGDDLLDGDDVDGSVDGSPRGSSNSASDGSGDDEPMLDGYSGESPSLRSHGRQGADGQNQVDGLVGDQVSASQQGSGLFNLFFGWFNFGSGNAGDSGSGSDNAGDTRSDSLNSRSSGNSYGSSSSSSSSGGGGDSSSLSTMSQQQQTDGEHDDDEFHVEFHDDHHCPERLSVAFSEIQWCIDEFTLETLSYYKRVIKKLYEKAYGHGEVGLLHSSIPPPYEWDKPYRLLPMDELRELAKSRGLASPLGASVKTKDELLGMLATFDYDAFENEYK